MVSTSLQSKPLNSLDQPTAWSKISLLVYCLNQSTVETSSQSKPVNGLNQSTVSTCFNWTKAFCHHVTRTGRLRMTFAFSEFANNNLSMMIIERFRKSANDPTDFRFGQGSSLDKSSARPDLGTCGGRSSVAGVVPRGVFLAVAEISLA